jgi:hypothetical protein
LIGPPLAQTREATLETPEHESSAIAVLHVGRMHDHLEQQAERIDQDVPLASIHLLAAVIAMGAALFGRLDRVAVDDGGAGRRLTASRATHALP